MKALRILQRNIRDALKSVFRNFSLSIASITCIIITLILVAIGGILSQNVNSFIEDLQSELIIVVYAEKDATKENITDLTKKLNEMKYVTDVVYNTKEEVKQEMMEEYDAFKTLMSPWTEETNPLLNRFKIKVDEVTEIKATAEKIKEMEYVHSVAYGEKVVDQMLPIFKWIERAAIFIVIALVLVTAFLISNTIKLTIFSRRYEIEIMRLVGTSNIVIKLPFLFEGLILGIIGSIIPVIISIYGYMFLYDNFGGYMFSNIFKLIKPTPFIFYLAALLVLVGAIVGMFGSYRAVRKYLKI